MHIQCILYTVSVEYSVQPVYIVHSSVQSSVQSGKHSSAHLYSPSAQWDTAGTHLDNQIYSGTTAGKYLEHSWTHLENDIQAKCIAGRIWDTCGHVWCTVHCMSSVQFRVHQCAVLYTPVYGQSTQCSVMCHVHSSVHPVYIPLYVQHTLQCMSSVCLFSRSIKSYEWL